MAYRVLKKTGLTQAGGAQTFDISGYEGKDKHQLQITPSATPSAGTLTVAAKTPGASSYVDIGTIDMTGSDLIVQFEGFYDSVRITPASFDAAKTYDAFLFSLQG